MTNGMFDRADTYGNEGKKFECVQVILSGTWNANHKTAFNRKYISFHICYKFCPLIFYLEKHRSVPGTDALLYEIIHI